MLPSDNGVYTITGSTIYIRDLEDGNPVRDSVSSLQTASSLQNISEGNTTMGFVKCATPRVGYAIDAIIGSIVTLLVILIEYGNIPHAGRGFWCNDASLGYVYQSETISATTLMVSCTLGPLIIMSIVEAFAPPLHNHGPITSKRGRTKVCLIQSLRFYREFLLGFMLHLMIIEAVKVVVGEHRPHFLHTCKPNPGFNCTVGTYITKYECTNTEATAWFVQDSERSFPSGHSSSGFFSALFMVWYLHNRLQHLNTMYLVPLLQCVLIFWGSVCAVTRITDHRHHWWDVVIGGIFGIMTGVVTAHIICKDFKVCNPRSKSLSACVVMENGNMSDMDRHTSASVRRLISQPSCKDDNKTQNGATP